MIEERSSGIILRIRPLTETSLIVHWLTPELGRLATVAKGARRPKSPLRGKLDLFHTAEFSFSRSRRSELHTLREAVLRQTHPVLRQDMARLQQAAYGVALIELATETETPLPGLFEVFNAWLDHLDQHDASVWALVAFELHLLHDLGLAPGHADGGQLSRRGQELLTQLASFNWAQLTASRPDLTALGELERFLGLFLARHLGRAPRGRSTALGLSMDPGAKVP